MGQRTGSSANQHFVFFRRLTRRVVNLLMMICLCSAEAFPASAEAVSAAAEQPEHSCLGTVVILAEISDAPGRSSLQTFRTLAEGAKRYYALNSYGCVDLAFTFMDAACGPSAGSRAWYNVGPTLSAYNGNGGSFAIAALQRAFVDADLPAVVHLERAIVVCPVGERMSMTASFSPHSLLLGNQYYIEVQGARRRTRVYVPDLVLVSELDDLGTWVHEIGHTLYSSDTLPGMPHRITDRYTYSRPEWRFGQVGYWDLMGFGCRWGNPRGTSPVHMSSYTKEAAGWLRYTRAAVGQEHTLVALEHQQAGDAVSILDDPASDDSLCYYILEARDAEVFFGAPESGVVLYHVTYDHSAGHAVVNTLSPQQGAKTGNYLGLNYERPTLHGIAQPDGMTEYVADGFRIKLLAESFSPYRATVRIERYDPNTLPLPQPGPRP